VGGLVGFGDTSLGDGLKERLPLGLTIAAERRGAGYPPEDPRSGGGPAAQLNLDLGFVWRLVKGESDRFAIVLGPVGAVDPDGADGAGAEGREIKLLRPEPDRVMLAELGQGGRDMRIKRQRSAV